MWLRRFFDGTRYKSADGDRGARIALGVLGGSLVVMTVGIVGLYVSLRAGHFADGVDIRFVSGYAARGDVDAAVADD